MLGWLSQILFCERTGSAGADPIKPHLKRLWLVVIATILSKTFIHFLFTNAIAHNWSFFIEFKQTVFYPYTGYHKTLIKASFYIRQICSRSRNRSAAIRSRENQNKAGRQKTNTNSADDSVTYEIYWKLEEEAKQYWNQSQCLGLVIDWFFASASDSEHLVFTGS